MHKFQKGNFLPLAGILILVTLIAAGAYYLGTQKNNQTLPAIEDPVFTNSAPEDKLENTVSVKVIDGDIVVEKDGEDKTITDWGYNSDPVLSPNGDKIAFISKTEESFENEKKYQGYVPSSTNVWVINTDGSDPLKVTEHDNWVFRNNLLWLDNNRLLFTDGESSARVYNLAEKSTKTVLGPEKPEGICVDACGASDEFFISPDKRHLLLLGSDGNGGVVPTRKSGIVNLETLESVGINQKFSNVDFKEVVFEKDYVTFEGSESVDQEAQKITVNLNTGEASFSSI